MAPPIMIRRSEAELGNLPPVCICCGATADHWEHHRCVFRSGGNPMGLWLVPWIGTLWTSLCFIELATAGCMLPLLGIYLVGLLRSPIRATLYLPLCGKHRSPWLRDRLCHWAQFVLGPLIWVCAAGFPFLAFRIPFFAARLASHRLQTMAEVVVLEFLLCLLPLWMLVFLVLTIRRKSVGVENLNERSVWLRAHPDFGRALERWRLAPEDLEEDGDPSRFPEVFLADELPPGGVLLPSTSEGIYNPEKHGEPPVKREEPPLGPPDTAIQPKGDT